MELWAKLISKPIREKCKTTIFFLCNNPINFVSVFFFSSRSRHTISKRDWSSDVCSSDLPSSSRSPIRLGLQVADRGGGAHADHADMDGASLPSRVSDGPPAGSARVLQP